MLGRFTKRPAVVASVVAERDEPAEFVGPVIVHAWMQAVGIVNDHAADCFRRGEV